MKNFTILFIAILFLLLGCRDENFISDNSQPNDEYYKTINFSKLKNELSLNSTFNNSNVSKTLTKIIESRSIGLTSKNQSLKDDFITSIDTENIIKIITKKGLVTYTLNVVTKDSTKSRHFYQLVLISEENKFDYKLIKYTLNHKFHFSDFKKDKSRIKVEEITIDGNPLNGRTSKMQCATLSYVEVTWAACIHHGKYVPEPGCDGGHWEYTLKSENLCSSEGDGNSGWVDSPLGDDGSSGGVGPGGTSSYLGSIPTNPTIVTPATLIMNFYPDYNPAVDLFVNNYKNKIIVENLAMQLQGTPVAQSKIDFVKWSFDFFIANSTNSMSNISWAQFENWFTWTSSMFTEFPNEEKKLFNIFISENIHISPNVLIEDYRVQMSQAELNIFDNMSRGNKLNYLYAAKIATTQALKLFPDSRLNGLGDAYRHTLWNALSTRYLGVQKTEQLTSAHENTPSDPNNPFKYKEIEMDLYNNSRGRFIGENFQPYETVNQVREFLITGKLKYLNNLKGGLSEGIPTSNSQLIPSNQ